MPSVKHCGAFEDMPGPVWNEPGSWSERWDKSSGLRYVPPHRPLYRLLSAQQPSVRELQATFRARSEATRSDGAVNYRLPGFNVHRPELDLQKTSAAPSNSRAATAWQTPSEAQKYELTRSLNERSQAIAEAPDLGASGYQSSSKGILSQMGFAHGSFSSLVGSVERRVRRNSQGYPPPL